MTTDQALQILDLSAPITPEALKKAFREAMMVWHPDRFEGNEGLKAKAASNTYQINEAHTLLKAISRSSYPFKVTGNRGQPEQAPPSKDNSAPPPCPPRDEQKSGGINQDLVIHGVVVAVVTFVLLVIFDHTGSVPGFTQPKAPSLSEATTPPQPVKPYEARKPSSFGDLRNTPNTFQIRQTEAKVSPKRSPYIMLKTINVQQGDTLAIRASPGAEARKIADIPHDAKGIELRGGPVKIGQISWYRVHWKSEDGWVNGHFLDDE